ncbi:MAG: cadmium-translocating P-type ATPase [Oscillospiraceae bacterium]|nr:cadmium-translocating P-type ATPase [Oscillospiraceae bacterium]
MTKKQKKMLTRILLASALMILLHFVPAEGLLRFGLYLIPYLIIGHDLLRKAFLGIRNKQVFDENFLMAVATIGAMVIGVTQSGDYTEAIAVMLFFQIGELFENYAIGKSRRSISALMDIRPDYANVEIDGQLEQVDPDEVAIDTIIVVNPGEKVPIDGIVVEGYSSLNTSALTGESLPRDVHVGDEIISGCINQSGVLKVRTTKEFGDSTVSKILDLVENASSRKSRSENFVSKFAAVYTPIVCGSALLLAVIPPVVCLFLGIPAQWSVWLYRALSFLVASCPCALVISIPLSFFAGIGGASQAGVLIKGSNYLEALSKTDTVVFDKTGTLTCGTFSVTNIYNNTLPQEKLLELAALAESASSHPISKALQNAYGKVIDRSRVTDIQEIGGYGITAKVDGVPVSAGNAKLMAQLDLTPPPCSAAGTTVHIAVNGSYAGCILLSDTLKPSAEKAIRALCSAGVKRTIVLTGDNAVTAQQVADQLGIQDVYSQLLPGDKVEKVEQLLASQRRNGKLAFVGDGINDAPVLSRADIGIAMGAMGSDAAIEAADIVLMDDDPMKIAKAIKISRKCLGIVYQNIVFAIAIKVLALVLVAFGIANMWIAIFADVGVMVLAVLNAVRAMFVSKL